MKFKLTPFRTVVCIGACFALNGCLSSTPHWDQTFGDSIHQVTAMQVLNPQAGQNDDPVNGIDGSAANSLMANYDKSFTAPPPPMNMFTIGVGAPSGSSSGN
ncbi:hypothetical protein FAZ69_02715 [Trinickia terrae]|uniref:Pilus assembly protein n=1 Tax=Trinickia terrae TaxID=2571161 RepID=A0A4U1IFS8_9BURK|nr:hypothetical protein [Trinickia terrae]TKC92599.1 hypothetical protein FAZ69_02715 [Trinickia terrae]